MYRKNNKEISVCMLLLCFTNLFCVDDASDRSVKANNTSWLSTSLLVAVTPMTVLGSALLGASVSAPLLLVMNTEAAFKTQIPLATYLAGFGYGLYRSRDDIIHGELSVYSQCVAGACAALMALGLLCK